MCHHVQRSWLLYATVVTERQYFHKRVSRNSFHGGHVWWGGVHGRGHALQGGIHGRGPCVAGGDMHGRGACVVGDMWGRGCVYRRDGHCRGRYASSWNAFLLQMILLDLWHPLKTIKISLFQGEMINMYYGKLFQWDFNILQICCHM